MGWFSRSEPKPDPIGDICRLLVEKAWEWTPGNTGKPSAPKLSHISGVWLAWDNRGSMYRNDHLRVFFGVGAESLGEEIGGNDAVRLFRAVQGNAAARAVRPRVNFDDATKAMAKAVLAGDAEAARLLADFVMEHCGGTKTEGA